METKIFSLTEKPNLPIGCKVFSYGYAMTETKGVVISEPDNHGSQKCVSISDDNSVFFRIEKHAKPISKKFGIGVYYSDSLEIVDETIIEKAIRQATEENTKREKAALEKQKADTEEISALPALFPYLVPISNGGKAMNNIRLALKHNFPGVKFSVTNPHGSTCEIKWTDGYSIEEVDKIANLFEDSKTDITGDYRDYSPSNFNHVFGGMKYVFTSRMMSKETENVLMPIIESLYNESRPNGGELYNCRNAEQLTRNIFYKSSIPVGSTILGIEPTGETCGLNDINVFYRIKLKLPENSNKEPVTVAVDGIQIIDYSEKAIAVVGETKPIKDTLKGLGGKFNFRLSCGAGWIFPKTKEAIVRNTLFQSPV